MRQKTRYGEYHRMTAHLQHALRSGVCGSQGFPGTPCGQLSSRANDFLYGKLCYVASLVRKGTAVAALKLSTAGAAFRQSYTICTDLRSCQDCLNGYKYSPHC